MRSLRAPQTSRLRVVAVLVVAALFVLFLSANGVASFYTDWLWFDHLGFGQVWSTMLTTRLLLAAVFSVLFFLILWGNLFLADRIKPPFRPDSPEEDLVERYHAMVGDHAGKVRVAVAAMFGLIAGANTSAQWETWLLFRSGSDFGRTDPQFNMDVGFYVFRLPFWTFLIDWFFASLVLTLIVVAVAHYLTGGIRAAAPTDRVTPAAKFHISVLLAILAVLRAAAYYIDRFHLVTSTRGAYDGALATDVNIQLPALNLLALISLFCALLFVANVRRAGWGLPMVAIGIWLFSHFVIGGIFPLAYQRIRIDPVESQREAQFVERNIEATRFAYGLDESRLRSVDFDYQPGLTAEDADAYQDVLRDVPVVDADLVSEEVTRNEATRQFYEFAPTLDVDRYEIGGETRPVVLSARELNEAQVGDGWEREHIIYTHGNGVVMAAAYDSGSVSGESHVLDFLVSGLGEVDIDDDFESTLDQPRIYFGERFGGYAIINAERDELDYQTSSNDSVEYRYTGRGGVPMGSLVRRLAFSLRFREPDPLISRNVQSGSRVVFNRDIQDRVELLAPFLRFDSNPYPVVADGGVFWVIDGYTTTADFPYAQSVRTGAAGSLGGGYNYIRNSVKAVVDAYNGDVSLYIVDDSDPLIQAWSAAFPDLFAEGRDIPAAVRDHLRYPEGIFTVQTDMWSSYVVGNATEFIEGALAWSVAAQPRTEAGEVEVEAAAAGSMRPQYLMARLPGGDDKEFVLQRAFVPRGGSAGSSTERPELTGIMMARSDPANYGELVMIRLPGGEAPAPTLVHSDIRKSQDLTEFIKEKAGATVEFGEMSLVLVDDTIVYIRPVYVEANSATAVPELQRVVAVNGDRIFMGRSIEAAIAGILDGAPDRGTIDDDDETDAGGGTGGDSDQIEDPFDPEGRSVIELIRLADDFLDLADAAESNGLDDQAEEFRARARSALTAANDLLGGSGSAEPTSAGG